LPKGASYAIIADIESNQQRATHTMKNPLEIFEGKKPVSDVEAKLIEENKREAALAEERRAAAAVKRREELQGRIEKKN
jgi:hypothetical protein